jgi:hypothetical protein
MFLSKALLNRDFWDYGIFWEANKPSGNPGSNDNFRVISFKTAIKNNCLGFDIETAAAAETV